jgi:hypothetical protein
VQLWGSAVSDLRHNEAILTGSDSLYQQLVLNAAQACAGWAEIMFEGLEALLLWPRDRQDYPHGPAYRVNTRVVERGIWRVTLQPELPAGVDTATKDAVLKAEVSMSAMKIPFRAVDQVVQCGLFGEVLYR